MIQRTLLAAAILALSLAGCGGPSYDEECQAYLAKTLPVVLKDWDASLIEAEADKDLKFYIDQNRLAFTEGLRNSKGVVGSMMLFKNATLLSEPKVNPDSSVSAGYSVEGVFERGNAKLLVTLTRSSGAWHLGFFNLDPADLVRFATPGN